MKTRFIVLVDFSAYANNLLAYAYAWSQIAEAELLVVHQITSTAPALASHQQKRSIIQHEIGEAKHKLHQLCADVLPPEAPVQFLVSEIPLEVEVPILLQAPFQHVVFVGIKGTGLLKKIFIGSVAIQVIDVANAPVLALPNHVSQFSANKLFVAVSDKFPLNQRAFADLVSTMGRQIEEITFFYVAKKEEIIDEISREINNMVAAFAHVCNTKGKVYQEGSAISELSEIIKNHNHELLIIQKGSRMLSDQLFRKFTINELVYEGQIPMIVLP